MTYALLNSISHILLAASTNRIIYIYMYHLNTINGFMDKSRLFYGLLKLNSINDYGR
jgi:hypothetical protein